MKTGGMFGSKAGVTLVELLVVMLIVVILAVSLTPLFRDYIVRAQYAAEAVPVVGDLRTKIELYRYENNYLPGLPRNANGPTANNSQLTSAGVTSYAQTFVTNAAGQFLPGLRTVTPGNPASWGAAAIMADADMGYHFASDLNLSYENLTGSRLRPNVVYYYAARGDADSFTSGTVDPGYMYAVGIFGDGRLKEGSGYAVLEIHNPQTQTKVVATWERFRERGNPAGQAVLAAGEYTGTAIGASTNNICWIGTPSQLLNADKDQVDLGLAALRTAGWKF